MNRLSLSLDSLAGESLHFLLYPLQEKENLVVSKGGLLYMNTKRV